MEHLSEQEVLNAMRIRVAEATSPSGPPGPTGDVTPLAPEKDELEILFPKSPEFTVNGETISVRVMTFGEVTDAEELMAALMPLYPALATSGMLDPSHPEYKDACALIVSKHKHLIFKLLARNIEKDIAWLRKVPGDIGLQMMMKFVELNLDFFGRRVAPLIAEIVLASLVVTQGNTRGVGTSVH